MAICTNNVREWEAHWRAMLPVDEIFDVVVDSAFVGSRKPEPQDLRDHARAARRRPGDDAVHRRCRAQLRGRAQARHRRDPVPIDRADDRRDRGGARWILRRSRRSSRSRTTRSRPSTRTAACSSGTATPYELFGYSREEALGIRTGRADRPRALPRAPSGRAAPGRRRERDRHDHRPPDRRGGAAGRQRAPGRGVAHGRARRWSSRRSTPGSRTCRSERNFCASWRRSCGDAIPVSARSSMLWPRP